MTRISDKESGTETVTRISDKDSGRETVTKISDKDSGTETVTRTVAQIVTTAKLTIYKQTKLTTDFPPGPLRVSYVCMCVFLFCTNVGKAGYKK